jgi:type VI secretion system secreted protein VgrG
MKNFPIPVSLATLPLIACGLMLPVQATYGETILGNAQSFAVLGASSVTNTGATTLGGDLGVFPGSSITGAGTITVAGATHQTDGVAQGAQASASTAYDILAALGVTRNISGTDLGGQTFTPGVYRFDSSAQLTGDLTIDFAGAVNSDVVFQIGSTLTTAGASHVSIRNAGANDGVFFQIGSSATLGASSAFAGNILAHDNISFGSAASIACGRAIALHAGVQMIGDSISAQCASSEDLSGRDGYSGGDFTRLGYTAGGFNGVAGAVALAVPEPATLAMLISGLLLVGAVLRRPGG